MNKGLFIMRIRGYIVSGDRGGGGGGTAILIVSDYLGLPVEMNFSKKERKIWI